MLPEHSQLRRAQLAAGREWATAPSFWRSYMQGATQYHSRFDGDPDIEGSALGITEQYTDEHGSFIFIGAVQDYIFCPRPDLLKHTVAHELGHQFGLLDQSGGIMQWSEPPECIAVPDWFTASHLDAIRSKGVQQ